MTKLSGLFPTVGAFLLACGAFGAAQAAEAPTPVILSETTFDAAAPAGWGYGYFYNDARPAPEPPATGYQSANISATLPEAPQNSVWEYSFNTTGLETDMDWGTGTGGLLRTTDNAVNGGAFVSPNRDDYTLTFKARAAGLAAGQTSANAQMEIQFYVGDADSDKRLQVNIPFRPTAEWQTFTFKLGDFALGANTTDAAFEASHNDIKRVRFNVNMHQAGAEFGFDAGNALYLDDVKVQVAYTPPVDVPMVGKTIFEYNFDDKPLWFIYGPWRWAEKSVDGDASTFPEFSNGANVDGAGSNTMGLDGSNAWYLQMNNFNLLLTGAGWGGGGNGGGGAVDLSHMTTTDLTKYRLTFAAKVQGLREGVTSTSAKVQLHFDAPDDTEQPADSNTDNDLIVRMDFPVGGLTTEFQTFSFPLHRGEANEGTKELLQQYLAQVSQIRIQPQIENAVSGSQNSDWEFDEDNYFIIDNIKFERLVPEGEVGQLGGISYSKQGNELVLTWTALPTGTTKLQSAATVDATFTDVTTEGNTYRAAIGTGSEQRYFRLIHVE